MLKSSYFKKSILYISLFIVIYNLKDFIKNNITKSFINIIFSSEEDNLINDNIIEETFKRKPNKSTNKSTNKSKNKEKKDDKNQMVLYKPKKESNYNLKDIYNNFFNKKKNDIEPKFDINIFKNIKKNENIIKNKIILDETKENINLDKINNFLLYNFESNRNRYYKIICKINTINLTNIKLIITDNKKRFIYDYNENNPNDDKILDYSFILDYNNFDIYDSIFVYIMFYNDSEEDNININNLSIQIIETIIEKKIDNSIIIFNINDKYYPIFTNEKNILDHKEFNDTTPIFFI